MYLYFLTPTATHGGKDCFRCLDRNDLNAISVGMRYLGYAYICTLLFEFWMKTLEARQGKVQSVGALFRDLTWILTSFIALIFVPVGYYAFSPIVHTVIRSIQYGVKVLQSASRELNFISPEWEGRMHKIEILGWTMLCAQQYWVYTNLQCDRAWANLMGAGSAATQAIFTLLQL